MASIWMQYKWHPKSNISYSFFLCKGAPNQLRHNASPLQHLFGATSWLSTPPCTGFPHCPDLPKLTILICNLIVQSPTSIYIIFAICFFPILHFDQFKWDCTGIVQLDCSVYAHPMVPWVLLDLGTCAPSPTPSQRPMQILSESLYLNMIFIASRRKVQTPYDIGCLLTRYTGP